jgi:hypothetical protein
MSAALDDPTSGAAFRADVIKWFEELERAPSGEGRRATEDFSQEGLGRGPHPTARGEGNMNKTEERIILSHTPGNPEEMEYYDKFGTHFEVRYRVPNGGPVFSRRITRCQTWGWTVTWDEARDSVMEAARAWRPGT